MSEHRHRPFTPPTIRFIPIPKEEAKPLFSTGQVVMTPGAGALLKAQSLQPLDFLFRHEQGDWGDLAYEDKAANADALRSGARLLSAYKVGTDRLWIITDAADDDGKRASTCLLLPEEY